MPRHVLQPAPQAPPQQPSPSIPVLLRYPRLPAGKPHPSGVDMSRIAVATREELQHADDDILNEVLMGAEEEPPHVVDMGRIAVAAPPLDDGLSDALLASPQS